MTDYTQLIEDLRNSRYSAETCDSAADALEALQTENTKLHALRHEREDVISELRNEVEAWLNYKHD